MSETEDLDNYIVRPNGWLRREWRLLIGLALSAVCIYLAVRGLSPQTLKAALSASQWEWVVLAVAVVVVSGVLKAIRWRALFFPQRMGLGKVWRVLMIGQMLNVVLPARAGEIGRIFLIGETGEVHRAKALSTVVVEKTVDLVMLALAYLTVAVWLMTPMISSNSISSVDPIGAEDWLRRAGAVLLPIAALAVGGLLLLAYGGRPAWQFLRRIVNPLSLRWRTAASTAIDQAIAGFEALRHWQTGAQVWGLSLVIWALAMLVNLLLFNAFQLSLSPFVALFLLVVLMSGVAVAPLPGNLGVFPFLCQLVLSLFGVTRETALIYGVVLQLVVNLPLLVLGSASMLWENWSLRRSSSVAVRNKTR